MDATLATVVVVYAVCPLLIHRDYQDKFPHSQQLVRIEIHIQNMFQQKLMTGGHRLQGQIKIDNGWDIPRYIREKDVDTWPHVKSGLLNKNEALTVFNKFYGRCFK